LWRILDKVNALLNVAFQALHTCIEEPLLVAIDILEGIGCSYCTGRLMNVSQPGRDPFRLGLHTPSSTGTEKKSSPVSLATASPPEIPGR
jgi:hypothetical protein